jgi:hypothetical protein
MAIHFSRPAIGLSIAAVAGLAAACAATFDPQEAASRSGRQCFNVSQVNGFDAIDRDTVQVTVGASQVYELELVGTCPEIDWSNRIAIRSTGGSSWICEGLDAELIVPSPSGTQRCPAIGVRKLTPVEVEALRAKRKG